MKLVSRFEANLLRLLQFFLRRLPAEHAMPLIIGRCAQPPLIGKSALSVIQDHLGKGCTLLLARLGGWRNDRFQRGDKVVDGRLWGRTPPAELGLVFSAHSLRFLMWITAQHPSDDKAKWAVPEKELTPADWFLYYLVYHALRDTEIVKLIRNKPGFIGNALVRLAYPDDFDNVEKDVSFDFGPWTSGVGSGILEALQHELANRWTQIERQKGAITDWQRLRSVGQAQDRVLDRFMLDIVTANRRDLARFLWETAQRVLTPDATPSLWVNLKAVGPRLVDRTDTYRAAMALVSRVERFRQWEHDARTVGYFDEGYAASQLVKAEWERWQGETMLARAERIVRDLDPMKIQESSAEGQANCNPANS